MRVRELDVAVADGRTLHVYDTGPSGGLAVCWHHGTPNIGAPPVPLFEAAERLGIRWFSSDRPGYGGATREAFEEAGEELDTGFSPGDEEALGGRWSWFLDVVRPAIAAGPAAAVEDDLAAVAPWDFDPADIASPVLVVHGEADRMVPVVHGRWLAGTIPGAQLWVRAGDGHITVMDAAEAALAWLSRAQDRAER